MLAAGGSTRLGRPKQLLPYDGKSLLRRAAETAVGSVCDPVVVVLGASAAECLPELHDLPVSTVINADWAEGMGSSLRVGVETLLATCPLPRDAILVMLCDQPLLTARVLDGLVDAYTQTASPLVASAYDNVTGVPALFDRSLFPELLRLSGAQGARSILQQHAAHTHHVAFPDGAIDIDTAADYARLSRL